jgi:hypothetical protein
MLPQAPWLAWGTIGFCGLGVVVFATQIVRPSVLLLDAGGFEPHVLFHRRESRRQWEECSTFTASDDGPAKLIVYSTTRKDLTALRAVNTALAGGDEAVQAGFSPSQCHATRGTDEPLPRLETEFLTARNRRTS